MPDWKIDFYPAARAEANEALDWYQAEDTAVGQKLVLAIEKGAEAIAAQPTRWPLVDKRVRRLVLRRFPYSLFYLIEGETVWIVAVAHHRRKPGYWRSRVKSDE